MSNLREKIIETANTVPITKKVTKEMLKIFFASLNRPLALLFETIIESATGKPAFEIMCKNA